MISEISIVAGGMMTLAMGIFHTQFYRRFQWEQAFSKIGQVNSRIFYSINLALTLLFILLGLLTLIWFGDLAQCEGLALGFNLIMSGFWFWRFIWQLTYFRKIRRKRKSAIIIILEIWFFLLFVSYSIPIIIKF